MYVPCAPIVRPAKPSPAPLDGGTLTFVSSSPSPTAVMYTPRKNSSAGTVRSPSLPANRERRVERDEQRREGGSSDRSRRRSRRSCRDCAPGRPRSCAATSREDRPRDLDLRRAHELRVRHHRADLEHPVGREADRAQLVEVGEVDEHVGRSRARPSSRSRASARRRAGERRRGSRAARSPPRRSPGVRTRPRAGA